MSDAVAPEPAAPPRRRLGLRTRIVLLFALGALVTSLVSTGGTYLAARTLLINQRQRVAIRQAITSSHYVAARHPEDRTRIGSILATIPTSPDSVRLIRDNGSWYAAEALRNDADVPEAVVLAADQGQVSYAWADTGSTPVLVVGVPLPQEGMSYVEVSSNRDLEATLATLRGVLTLMAILGTVSGAAVGWMSARRSVRPLQQVAAAGSDIGAGAYGTRLPPTNDPDLAVLTDAFNTMADQVEQRIARDARFAAEVGHELRSPLTTLVTAVGLLKDQRDQIPADVRVAVDLADQEVQRFGHTLEDLLRLGALDGGRPLNLTRVSATEVVRATLLATHRPVTLLTPSDLPDTIAADKETLGRAVSNLLDNADKYADGVTGVRVLVAPPWVRIIVEDRGPGVPEDLRERIFERFVRGGARGSKPGTGLGLSIVAETARAHSGEVAVWGRTGGGSQFVLSLPLQEPA